MAVEFFQNFPFRGYTLDPNASVGDYVAVQDIFKRVKIDSRLMNDARVFYPYQIKDTDSPESIAFKYYGSPHYFWVVCLVNGMTDPLRDWPKNYHNFVQFIKDEYGTVESAMTTVHHYTKTVTKLDSDGNTSAFESIIDVSEYNTLASVVPEVFTFADGKTVTVTTTRGSVDCYTYEEGVNEAKRSILLLKQDYLSQIRTELETLMSDQ